MDISSISRNRELSWLKFNERVLEEALADIPLLEKLKFIAIFMSNLNEFYMVRVGSLTDKTLLKNPTIDNKTGWTVQEQLEKIFDESSRLVEKKDRIYFEIEKIMNSHGIHDLGIEELTEEEKKLVEKYYQAEIKPILSPQIIESSHPFPFIQGDNFYLVMKAVRNKKEKFAIMRIPESLPPIYILERGTNLRYIRTENIVKEYVDELYENYRIRNKNIINITRNADLTLEEEMDIEDHDFKSLMLKILKKRKKLQAVGLMVDGQMDIFVEKILLDNLNLKKEQVFVSKSPMNMSYIFSLENYLDNKEKLLYDKFTPQPSSSIDPNKPLIQQIQKQELLLIYPFEDMQPMIDLLDEAGEDPRVESIKMTIYRLADNSKIIHQLVKAAKNGKDVTVLIELRARFDEQSNIDYSQILYQAGCQVIYGQPGYKVHSKICLITMRDKEGLSYITQFGTGNYNEITSKSYTDICYITANKKKGEDAVHFFNNMSIGNLEASYQEIITAPNLFKPKMLELIEDEIIKGPDGFLFFKFNSLSDKDFIEAFYRASEAGCRVQLIIRGICCLKPGLDNVEIHSIVGRYLEHSRIYIFGRGNSQKIYISSADLMTRNTQNRVEIAVPIYSEKIKDRLLRYMEVQWLDDIKGRVHTAEMDFAPINTGAGISSQDYFMDKAMTKRVEEQKLNLWQKILRFFKKFS